MNTLSVCLIGLRPATSEYCAVAIKKGEELDIPSIKLHKDKNIEQSLEELIAKYVDLDVNWIPKRLVTVVKDGTNLNVIYSGQIPYDTPLKKGATWQSSLIYFKGAVEATQYL